MTRQERIGIPHSGESNVGVLYVYFHVSGQYSVGHTCVYFVQLDCFAGKDLLALKVWERNCLLCTCPLLPLMLPPLTERVILSLSSVCLCKLVFIICLDQTCTQTYRLK